MPAKQLLWDSLFAVTAHLRNVETFSIQTHDQKSLMSFVRKLPK